MMYAIAMVAEREIPARQCTMTLQFDTLALSVGGQAPIHIFSKTSADKQHVFKLNYHFLEGDKGAGGHQDGCEIPAATVNRQRVSTTE